MPDYRYPLAAELAGEEPVRLRLVVPLARRVAGAADEQRPLGELLADARAAGDRAWLFEEESPGRGLCVVLRRQRARWQDGPVHASTARRRESSTGRSSSGPAFDVIEPPAPP